MEGICFSVTTPVIDGKKFYLYIHVCASSSPSERVISTAGHIIKKGCLFEA